MKPLRVLRSMGALGLFMVLLVALLRIGWALGELSFSYLVGSTPGENVIKLPLSCKVMISMAHVKMLRRINSRILPGNRVYCFTISVYL